MPGQALRTALAAYAVAPGLLLKQWDASQAVVFHPATNSTHLVNAAAAEVLAALSGAEAERHGTPPMPGWTQDDIDLAATLDALSQAGLVRRVAD